MAITYGAGTPDEGSDAAARAGDMDVRKTAPVAITTRRRGRCNCPQYTNRRIFPPPCGEGLGGGGTLPSPIAGEGRVGGPTLPSPLAGEGQGGGSLLVLV